MEIKYFFNHEKILVVEKKIEILFYRYIVSKISIPAKTSVKMSSQNIASVDMSVIPASSPSLCIPRVFANITEKRVAFVIRDVGLGEIDRIDMVPKTTDDGVKFQRVFIHFKKWNTSESAQRARERVLSGKEIKIVYDDPWFWKLSANRSVARPTRDDEKPRQQRARPRLVDDDDRAPRAKTHSPRNSHGGRPTKPTISLSVPGPAAQDCEIFGPSSPIDPPPKDDVDASSEAAWTRVDYGNLPPVKKNRRVVKPPV